MSETGTCCVYEGLCAQPECCAAGVCVAKLLRAGPEQRALLAGGLLSAMAASEIGDLRIAIREHEEERECTRRAVSHCEPASPFITDSSEI